MLNLLMRRSLPYVHARVAKSFRYGVPTLVFRVLEEEMTVMNFVRYIPNLRALQSWCLVQERQEPWEVSDFRGINRGQLSYVVSHENEVLHLTSYHLGMAAIEWKTWEDCYLPKFPLDGKTVLDVGSGSGETAHFYFLNGARKVIAIEPERRPCDMLRENALRNGWTIEIIEREFAPEDLEIPHDFMKMDCEGCENILLSRRVRELQPCVIETHDFSTSNALQRKFGLTLVLRVTQDVRILAMRALDSRHPN